MTEAKESDLSEELKRLTKRLDRLEDDPMRIVTFTKIGSEKLKLRPT